MYYSYKMTYDYGFAPNPFWGVCSLSTCKPTIRRKAVIGDWILGIGSEEMDLTYKVIYLMKVTEKLSFSDYWSDERWQSKKPTLNGSLITIHGDNVYSKDEAGQWQQAVCQHTHPDISMRQKHIVKDTGGKFVLLSNHFYYFGDACFEIDDEYKPICSEVRSHRKLTEAKEVECFESFTRWVAKNYKVGIHGDPIGWKEYNQFELVFDWRN